MYIFECEDTLDGIFTGVYDAWASGYGHNNISLRSITYNQNMELFCSYVTVTTDLVKSQKVARTLRQRFGIEVYTDIYRAAMADEHTNHKNKKEPHPKADALYKSIVLGLSLSDGTRLMEHLSNPYVHQVFTLARATGNEAHHLMGFLRFRELDNGILFATIHPRNHVLSLLGDHFSDRFPNENFIIYDDGRKEAVIHKKRSPYILADASHMPPSFSEHLSEKELNFQELWKTFFDSIAIEARYNPALQNQLIPKRFQKDAIEFSS